MLVLVPPPRSIPLPRSRTRFLALAHPAFAPATRTRAPHARVQLLWIRVCAPSSRPALDSATWIQVRTRAPHARVQFLWVRVLRSIPRDLRSSPLPGSASPFSSPASPGSWGRCASRSAGMFHVKHPYALEGGAQDGTRAGERPATDRFPAHGRECSLCTILLPRHFFRPGVSLLASVGRPR